MRPVFNNIIQLIALPTLISCFAFLYINDLNFAFGNIENTSGNYITENVIIMVMDGPRYSETWGDSTHAFITFMKGLLAEKGACFTNFYNNGPTYTNAGHTAITTGVYQEIGNNGYELPDNPSIFQLYQFQKKTTTSNWIIASKGKLDVLSNCKDPDYNNLSMPLTNCGIEGRGSEGGGYRDDHHTFEIALSILKEHHPKMALINFMEPDKSGHEANWEGYLKGITQTDYYLGEIWSFIQKDSIYAGKTSVFITNDHGRHLDGWKDGYISHGDNCLGCRHINLYASGPDFKKNIIVSSPYELIDITKTIAELMGIENLNSKGKVIWEIFIDKHK